MNMRIYLSGIAIGVLATFSLAQGQESSPGATPPNEFSSGVISPQASFIAAPLKPTMLPARDQSVLLGYSPFYVPSGGMSDTSKLYEPIREGGFRVSGGGNRLNRPIIHGQNMAWGGDVALFKMSMIAPGDGSAYLIPKDGGKAVTFGAHSLGTLRLGVVSGGQTVWLEDLSQTTTATFLPGSIDYEIRSPKNDWTASVRMTPVIGTHAMVCRIEFDREQLLQASYGDVTIGRAPDAATAEITVAEGVGRFVVPKFPNLMVLAGWDAAGDVKKSNDGKNIEFLAAAPRKVYYIVASWGFSELPKEFVSGARKNLDSAPAVKNWPKEAEEIWQAWQECYVNPATEPEAKFRAVLADPKSALDKTVAHWSARRGEFQIRTPDAHFDSIMNWARAVSDYHVQGPALVLGTHGYQLSGHISMAWYGKEWGGDRQTMERMLRHYAIGQGGANNGIRGEDKPRDVMYGGQLMSDSFGWISWMGPNFTRWLNEDNTAYWVHQVYQHYRWSGDQKFVRDLWPSVKQAVAWECAQNDADGDGLFWSFYPFWNADSYDCLQHSASATAVGWAMLDAAARMAVVAGDTEAAGKYRAYADKSKAAADRVLWNDRVGVFTSVSADGLEYSHPNAWEPTQAVVHGLLDAERGRRTMRWVESHYGFEGSRPDVRLIMTSDLWPLRWSNQWVATGDTLFNALAGLKSGDVDLWWPYIRTAVHSSFRSSYPGINFAINNTGMGSGDREDCDSDDPHPHLAVRGVFGIEPAIDEGKLFICPAFPSDWNEASIQTPDVCYQCRREGDTATFIIRTSKPLVKHVRANLSGAEVVTGAETESTVKVKIGPRPAVEKPQHDPSILVNKLPKTKPVPLSDEEQKQLLLVDLSGTYNITHDQFMTTPMLFERRITPIEVKVWWHNPGLTLPPGPREITSGQGVKFLTAGRAEGAESPKSLLALTSWKPYPWPAGAKIPLNRKATRLWLMMQNYVSPAKSYVPHGEVILHYADGKTQTTSLVPPFNMDGFYQVNSLEGEAVPYGQFVDFPYKGYCPATIGEAGKLTQCHATSLEIPADPSRVLESVEIRATCSQGILGVVGLTLQTNQQQPQK
jgi:hypothetical protein